MTLNDMIFYNYNSELKSKIPRPEWLHTTAAQNHWNDIQNRASYNRDVLNLAFEQAVLQYNKTDLEQVAEHCGTQIVSEGFGLPRYMERMALNDMIFYNYHSELKSEVPRPEWLHTTEAQNHWNYIQDWASHNRYVLNLAFEQAVLQFNKTGTLPGANLYQSSGCCRLYPDGTYKGWLSHAFNGMDFVYLDIDSRTYIPLVPQATIFKILREKNQVTLDIAAAYYREKCLKRLNAFKEAAGDRFKMVPKVKLFENQNHGKHLITCHVTGFYPREIQVDLLGPDLDPLTDGFAEVLPNGDGTYQTRKSVPVEHTAQTYRCVVRHGTIKGNITMEWVREERNRIAVCIYVAVLLLFIIGLGFACWFRGSHAAGS